MPPRFPIKRYLDRYLGGTNLEVFKFGMYILFPIGFMYYFGTNLEERFSVPGFWPKLEEQNRVPTDRDEIKREMDRLKARRLRIRDERLAKEVKEEEEVRRERMMGGREVETEA